MQPRPAHEAIIPISWLLGRWVSTSGKGIYPTIKPFEYCEEIVFRSVGQPLINYSTTSWHPSEKRPMHFESGFLRIKPGTNQLAFMVAHNFGLTTLEEGKVDGNTIVLKTTTISRMEFAKDPSVTKLERRFQLNGDVLEQIVSMETSKTPLQEHTRAYYKKVPDPTG